MKKIFAILVFAFTMLTSVANAQSVMSPKEAYSMCKALVKQGNKEYKAAQFVDAQDSYEQALDCNKSCPDKKYMSDKKIQKKIDDCIYALNHGGKTRQQANAEAFMQVLDAISAVSTVATAVAVAATPHDAPHDGPHHGPQHHGPQHDGPQHEFHHDGPQHHMSIADCFRDNK